MYALHYVVLIFPHCLSRLHSLSDLGCVHCCPSPYNTGDVHDDAYLDSGQLYNKWTLVSMSHSTVIFKMPRAALTAAVDTQAAAVENKRVSYLRRRHRDQWCRRRESALEGLVPDQLGPATGPDAVPVNILAVSPLYPLSSVPIFLH